MAILTLRTLAAYLLTLTTLLSVKGCGAIYPSALPDSTSSGIELPEIAPSDDIVRHLGYTASYNHATLVSDWVAWELTADELRGECNGKYPFSRDPDVDFPKASREDYANSGYDKGHMAPRADMKWSERALCESYYFTNICPQDHDMNSKAWLGIENHTRKLAAKHSAVYIVCGPIFDSANHRTIGPARVAVPDRFFKCLAYKDSHSDGAWLTVGFIVSNDSRQVHSPSRYAVSVDSVEAAVGRNLFPTLPESSEQTISL